MPSLSRWWLFAALLVALGAPARAAVLEDIVAKVNSKPLLLSEYRKNLRSVMTNYQRNLPALLTDEGTVKEIRDKVLDQMVDDELLAQEAEKLKVKVHERELDQGIEEVMERSFRVGEGGRRRSDTEMDKALKDELKSEGLNWNQFRERIRRQLRIRKVVEQRVRAAIKEPDDESAREAFKKFEYIVKGDTSAVAGMPMEEAQLFIGFGRRLRDNHSERVRVSHILVKTLSPSMVDKNKALKKARAIKKRLDADEDFYEIAKKESDDMESAPRGGDLGWILRGWMPKPFEDAAFALPVGEVSEPVGTDFGYHLIRLQEKKARESFQFDKVKLGIKEFLFNLDFQKKLQELVKDLRKKATVQVMLPTD